jgi:hypothetical protein
LQIASLSQSIVSYSIRDIGGQPQNHLHALARSALKINCPMHGADAILNAD